MSKLASLRYKASRDLFSAETLWKKCLGQKETIVLVQTDKNTVIGGFMPDQWEDTSGMKNSRGLPNCKDIVSGKPFLFYWVNDEIQIIKLRDDRIPEMRSDKDWLIGFGNGLYINVDQNKQSEAYARIDCWVHP